MQCNCEYFASCYHAWKIYAWKYNCFSEKAYLVRIERNHRETEHRIGQSLWAMQWNFVVSLNHHDPLCTDHSLQFQVCVPHIIYSYPRPAHKDGSCLHYSHWRWFDVRNFLEKTIIRNMIPKEYWIAKTVAVDISWSRSSGDKRSSRRKGPRIMLRAGVRAIARKKEREEGCGADKRPFFCVTRYNCRGLVTFASVRYLVGTSPRDSARLVAATWRFVQSDLLARRARSK